MEYFIAASRDADYVRAKWFVQSKGDVWVDRLGDADGMPAPLRVSAFVPSREEGEQLAAALRPRFEGRLTVNTLTVPVFDVTIVEATVADESGAIKAVWFNQAWLAERLRPGARLLLNGRLDRNPQPSAFALEVSTQGWKPGTYGFAFFASCRPAPGPFVAARHDFAVLVEGAHGEDVQVRLDPVARRTEAFRGRPFVSRSENNHNARCLGRID